ncbi:MAG TPA: crosslink repair DNA glycosylase YcaQ family protein, partial [Gaiellales bacterium]
MTALSVPALRRHVVAAQGYSTRDRRAGADEVCAAVTRLACVQLDSISAVARSHRLTLLSRVGTYPPGTVSGLLAAGRLFEFWAHEACLLPIELWPLMRRFMERTHRWWGPII